jgi:signal transduction histidine kinase
MAQRENGSPCNILLASAADATNGTTAGARQGRHRVAGLWRHEKTSFEGLIEALTALSGRLVALKARNRELEGEVRQLRAERLQLQPQPAAPLVQPITASGPTRPRRTAAEEAECRRLERDLHDSVQNELVALLVKLTLIEEDRDTPPALAGSLASAGAHATAALDSVREITLGIPPLPLTKFGVLGALRAQATRAPAEVSLHGTAPRSTEAAEVAVYFSCLEGIQNVAKHAGRDTHVTCRLHHTHGNLTVRIADDGVGFDPAQTPAGAGLGNIRDRIQTMGGSVELTSRPGRGTVLTLSLPWPPRHRDSRPPARGAEDRSARRADPSDPRA